MEKEEMNRADFDSRLSELFKHHRLFIEQPNKKSKKFNGIYTRYENPIVTAEHVPIEWRFDLSYETNPFLQERLGVNCTFNAGAMEHDNKILQ